MTYSQSAKGVTISRARALKELRDHGLCCPSDFAQFDADMGVSETYQAHHVLHWLGY